jgi:hypothetical protein
MSIARSVALILTGLIGLSGMAVGFGLLLSLASTGGDPVAAGYLIGGGIAAYGLIAFLGAVGTWHGSVPAWWAAVVMVGAGLILLTFLTTQGAELDQVFLGGAILWGADLLALLSPGTRSSLRRARPGDR